MAIRKIYTSYDKEMEILWSEEGIHLTIETAGVLNSVEFIIEPDDIYDVIEDLHIFARSIENANTELQKED